MITFKDFFSFKHNRFFWLNLAAMLAVIIAAPLITLRWLDSYTLHGEAVVVPDVKGLPLTHAENEIAKQDLRSVVVDSNYVKGVPAGSILEQNPAGGAKVKEGRTVYLTINTGNVPTVSIPDIMDNSSLRQAQAKLRALGFKLAEPVYISGEKDWVYSITYNGRELHAGERIPRESQVTLHVGDGNDTLPEDSLGAAGQGAAEAERPVVDKSWF